MAVIGNEDPTSNGSAVSQNALATTVPKEDEAEGKMSKEVGEGEREISGKGPPNAEKYDSEEERLAALVPQTDDEALMNARKLKAQKLMAKKTGTSLNPQKVSPSTA